MTEIILGPPGTGKTTRLLGMVEEELERGVPPDRIGYVSFTKRAAHEAVERATKKFNLSQRDLPFFRTLHSTCFSSLGLTNSDVFEGKKLREFGDWIGMEFSEHVRLDEPGATGFTEGDRVLFMENLSRIKMIPLREQYDENCDGLRWNVVERVSRGLAEYKKANSLVDYTDMLSLFVQQNWSPQLECLFVDEAQDLSVLQWSVVWQLAKNARRVVIAGDDDQAIYRWAGAAVEYFVDLPGEVSVLGQSWRVPVEVQSVATEVISRVSHRRPKIWMPREGAGSLNFIRRFDEVDVWEPEILVLARNGYLLRNLESQLRSDGAIYEIQGRSSVQPGTLLAVRLWEDLRSGKEVQVDDARRVYEMMSSGTRIKRGYKTLPGLPRDQMVDINWLRQHGGLETTSIWHEALDRIPNDESTYLLRALQRGEKTRGRPRIRLSTIHGSKGGEADHVVLLTDIAQRTWREARDSPEDEARVWYVATTRARHKLSIVAPSTNMAYQI